MAHYHLSYPPGYSVNDHIPKDPYSLQYVRVDNARSILKSLDSGAYMAKTDLKSAFHIMPIHADDWWIGSFNKARGGSALSPCFLCILKLVKSLTVCTKVVRESRSKLTRADNLKPRER